MLILVRFIGIAIMAIGVVFMLNPNMLKQVITFWAKGKRLYLVGILRLLLGIILLMTALQCRLVVVVTVLGILFLIGGVFIFALGLEKVKSIADRWNKKSLLVLRLIGLVPILIGALLVYSV